MASFHLFSYINHFRFDTAPEIGGMPNGFEAFDCNLAESQITIDQKKYINASLRFTDCYTAPTTVSCLNTQRLRERNVVNSTRIDNSRPIPVTSTSVEHSDRPITFLPTTD